LFNRKALFVPLKEVLKVLCVPQRCLSAKSKKAKAELKQAEKRLYRNLDIRIALRRGIDVPVIKQMLVNRKQEFLLSFQRNYMIESGNSESEDYVSIMKILNEKNKNQDHKHKYYRNKVLMYLAEFFVEIQNKTVIEKEERKVLKGVLQKRFNQITDRDTDKFINTLSNKRQLSTPNSPLTVDNLEMNKIKS